MAHPLINTIQENEDPENKKEMGIKIALGNLLTWFVH